MDTGRGATEMKIRQVPIHKIQIGIRFRTDDGDLESLAANIREMGLLQPIGIDEDFQLIFGNRRLIACGDILKWESIPCAILKIDSLVAGEYAENEFRKQFTPSERAAIGEAIRLELGKRWGGDRKSSHANAGLEKGESADLAATRAGFKSAESFERAKKVTKRGAPELVAAMDTGEMSISAAAAVSSQPKDEQRRIVQMPKDQQREVVKQIRKTKADQEENERRARDLHLFCGLYDAVQFIARFHEEPKETWAGLWRVNGFDFPDNLHRAIQYLVRLEKADPNERQLERVNQKTQ